MAIAVEMASHFIVVPYPYLVYRFGEIAAYLLFNFIATAIIRHK